MLRGSETQQLGADTQQTHISCAPRRPDEADAYRTEILAGVVAEQSPNYPTCAAESRSAAVAGPVS